MAFIVTDELGNPFSIVINSVDGSMIATPVPGVSPSTSGNAITQLALAVIAGALRLIGVQASGEPVEISAANDGLSALDQMLDAWNADGLAIYTTRSDDYALIPGQQSYTLGTGGDFNSNRPARINSVSIILLSNPSNPIEVPISMYTVDDWQNKIPVKNVNGSFPQVCYDSGDFPLRTLNFWPIPIQANNARIYSDQALGIPSTLQTALSFPPGYAEAFRYNLAVRLAPEFSAPISPIVQAIAIESLGRLKTMNAPELSLRSDLMAGNGGYNYKADMFGIPY